MKWAQVYSSVSQFPISEPMKESINSLIKLLEKEGPEPDDVTYSWTGIVVMAWVHPKGCQCYTITRPGQAAVLLTADDVRPNIHHFMRSWSTTMK